MNINIKEAKNILEYILSKYEKEPNDALLQNEFCKILRYLYHHNNDLRNSSMLWINKIENKSLTHNDILEICNIEGKESNIFYPVDNTKSNNYKYYVNNLGIMLIVKTKENKIYNYKEDYSQNPCWIIPIGTDGCIDNDNINSKEFFNSNGDILPVLVGHLSIYEQIKKTDMYNNKDGYEAHHITCIFGNDARDNRINNIISLPKELHVHAALTNAEINEAEKLYEKYKKELITNKL